MPRTARQQYAAGPRLPADTPLQPVDLAFFGTPTAVHHVGIVVADNQMIDARHIGVVVRVESYAWPGYVGATWPAGNGSASS